MVHYQIHNDFDIIILTFLYQYLHIFHCSKLRVNRTVIRDIISIVILRRLIDWTDPEYIDSQFFQIFNFPCNSWNIPHSIPIAVRKTSRIDLINDTALPPFLLHLMSPSCFFYSNQV